MRKNATWIMASDIEMFHYLHAVKVATFEQINRDLNKNASCWRLYKRVALLKSKGLLDTYFDTAMPKVRLISLTEAGFKKYLNIGGVARCELRSMAVLHDIELVDIRNRFLCSEKVASYYTENSLQTWNFYKTDSDLRSFVNLRSDGAIGAKAPDGIVYFAVEYEATQKVGHRYDDILQKYYQETDVVGVLYICKAPSILNQLKTKEKLLYGNTKPKFFYATIDDLLKGTQLVFESHDGGRIDLGGHWTSFHEKVNVGNFSNGKMLLTGRINFDNTNPR